MRFTESHEWIGDKGHVGITNFAAAELGDIVYIQLPKIGQKVKAGEEICVLESTKAAADVYAPVSGKIVAVNDAVRSNPVGINKDAEKTGWLFQIEPSNPRELDRLLTQEAYSALVMK